MGETVKLFARLEASQMLQPLEATLEDLENRSEMDMVAILKGYEVEISGAMTNTHPKGARTFYHAYIARDPAEILADKAAAAAAKAVNASDADADATAADGHNGPDIANAPPAIAHDQISSDIALAAAAPEGPMVPDTVFAVTAEAEEDDELMDYEEEAI